MIFYLISIILFLIAIIEGGSLILMRKKVITVTGTIVDITSAVSENYKQSNSKFATILYYVDGKEYTSENRIQVSMSSKIGDKKPVTVVIDHPNKIYNKSLAKFAIILSGAILCCLIGFLYSFH